MGTWSRRGVLAVNKEEWKRMNLPMSWSILKRECDCTVSYWLLELDMRAGVPDGTYDVVCGDGDVAEQPRFGGVVVANGDFDPKTTAEACYRAVCVGLYEMGERELRERPSIHHRFIEHLKYDRRVSAFVLDVGS